MRVRVLFFGIVRERLGVREETLDVPAGASVADLLGRLAHRHPGFGEGAGALRVAVGEEYVGNDAALFEDAEVAILPPVSGGASSFRIVEAPISLDELAGMVGTPAAGAIATFAGTTRATNRGRSVLRLEYEAYASMAVAELEKIGFEARERWEICEIAIVHRVGIVPIGETSVGIAVSAPHRPDAIEACRFAIDRLKEVAPIWKKEHFEGGEVWIGSLADCDHDHAPRPPADELRRIDVDRAPSSGAAARDVGVRPRDRQGSN